MSRIKEPIEVVRRKAARGEALTRNEQRRLDHWWATHRNPVTPDRTAPHSYRTEAFGFTIPQSEGLRCFKCGVPLHEVTATFGKITQFSKFDVVNWTTSRFETKIYVKNQKVAACADCCLLIKPLKDKGHALDFRSYD